MPFGHDALRQRQANSPAALFGRESWLEDAAAKLARHTRTVVGDTNADVPFGKTAPLDHNLSAATGKSVNGVFHHGFQRPLDQHCVALHWQVARRTQLE